jgi:hypothetical protein
MLPTTKGGGSPQHSRWPLLIATRILMNRVNPERGGGEWCEEDAIVKIMCSTSTDALRLPEIRISDLNILPIPARFVHLHVCEYALRVG